MSQLPDPPPASSPLPCSVRAMGIYLLGLVVLGVLFWALGLPDPWTLAVQWASGIVFVLMAVGLVVMVWAVVCEALR